MSDGISTAPYEIPLNEAVVDHGRNNRAGKKQKHDEEDT